MYSIGVDIGGTFVKMGAVDENYDVKVFFKIKVYEDDTPQILSMLIVFFEFVVNYINNNYENILNKNENEIINNIVNNFYENRGYLKLKNGFKTVKYDNIYNRLLESYLKINGKLEGELQVIGIATPGFPDNKEKKIVGGAPNLKNLVLGNFKDHLPYKIHIINDANAQGFYFNTIGEGKKYKNFVVLGLGTGIGGSIIINNEVYEGKNGWAAELGHIAINFDTNKVCNCGSIGGCSEMYGSVRSLIKNSELENITGEELWDEYLNYLNEDKKVRGFSIIKNVDKKEHIKKVVENWLKSLGALSGSLINIFNPEAIIYSGGIIGNRPEIVEYIKNISSKFSFNNLYMEVKFIAAKNTNYSGIIGAILFAQKNEK